MGQVRRTAQAPPTSLCFATWRRGDERELEHEHEYEYEYEQEHEQVGSTKKPHFQKKTGLFARLD